MLKYWKEMLIGFTPVLLLFLYFIGVNVVPILLAAAVIGVLFYVAR